MFPTRLRRGLPVVVALAMWGANPCMAADAAKTPPAVQRTAEPAPADGPAVTVRGQVVTPEGQPIGRATVVLRAEVGGQFYAVGLTHNRDVLARTTADNDGRFAFDGIAIPPRLEESITSLMRGQGGVELVAWADGRAPTIRSTGLSTRTWTFASSRRWHCRFPSCSRANRGRAS